MVSIQKTVLKGATIKQMSKYQHQKNSSGCWDPTADSLLEKEYNEQELRRKTIFEQQQYNKMVCKILKILRDSDYVLDGPINLINKKTGKKRRIY